ncbi:hypothetical protein E3U24_06235 [Paracoccus pantotrophus]|uniref:hypothetical protein n=1 Tax=Paracoccus pantotrophus TaxID=82367 RepID=UPI0011C02189|nr:hypothetical protein [Paracoccus pantotrophus]WGR64920.1 hypothetical protein E3U24_06235 [Paracoccus pantotrophus]
MTFSSPTLKKAIKVAQDLGLPIAGYEVLADGGVRVLTSPPAQSNQADAALDQWLKTQNG